MRHHRHGIIDAILLFSAFLILLSGATVCGRDYGLEFGVNNGYTGNLVKDSSDRKDTYTNTSLDLNLYPISVTRFNLTAEYTYYSRNFGLSNFLYGGGLTFIPTSKDSRLSVYVDGNFKHHKYRESNTDSSSANIVRNDFPTEDIDGSLALGYRLGQSIRFRIGSMVQSTGYSTEELDNRNKLQIFAGGNFSLRHFGALDIEAGYNYGNLDYVNAYRTIFDTIVVPWGGIRPGEQYTILNEGRLKSYYLSPRLSFPLGARTGVSFTFSYRSFIDKDTAAIVYGYSTGYVSPWVNEYDGNSIQTKVKTYLIPRLITTVGAGYWNKTYLKTVEEQYDEFTGGKVLSTLFAKDRADDQTRVYLDLQFPLVIQHTWHLEPSIRFDFTHNASTIDVYDYNDFAVSTSFNLQL